MSQPSSGSSIEAAMSILSHMYFAPILGKLIRARVPDLLDAGPVQSADLASVLGLNPQIRGILVDRPDVLRDSDDLLRARGVRDRCVLVGGNFFEAMGVSGDVWMLSQVLHDWPDAECRKILLRCRERMKTEDRLLVIEMIPVPGRPDVGIALLDMAMMMFGGEARQRTEAEYREWFAATEFVLTRVVETGTAFSILEVSPS
jgi:hypothetical protein